MSVWSKLSHTFNGADLVKDMKLTGQLAGHQLTHFHDALYKSQRSIITGSRSFTNVTMTKDLTSTGSVNGLDLAANLVYLDQDTTLDGSYQLSEASIKNFDVAGTVDGVDWDTILDKILRVGEEQTISSKYSFSSPTSVTFKGEIIGDTDDDNGLGFINDQKVKFGKSYMNASIPIFV